MSSKPGQDAGDDSSLLIASENEEKHFVRKSFRVPIPQGLVTLDHGGRKHAVKDLSMYGVGLAVTSPDDFSVGAVLESVRITFPDKTFLVDVRVVHISAYEGDSLICGMEIIHTHDSGYIDWMTRVISEIKTSVLGAVVKSS
ncbi:PilZ domain-containing protein [Desulfomicrobium escambiense]|uniref:PilZ domain-containing protein n=1 Tax=Desulfomicrobium escambiense TaxID=29503 RepID=UPI00041A6BB1|nr:PilZ domain-containing protein [Desulfomicrobium escambiense]